MKKPLALEQLIEELRAETVETTVITTRDSSAKLFLNEESADHDDPILLSRKECELLLTSQQSVDALIEVLGDLSEASIELHELDLSADTLDSLETGFSAVDET